MTLRERLGADLMASQKSSAADRVGVLRLVMAELKNREIEKRGKGGEPMLSDTEITELLRREVKKRKEAIALFLQGGRKDLASQDEKDIAIIEEYLPALMDREGILRVVRGLMSASGGEGTVHDFPTLMRETMKILKGQADGSEVKEAIESCLKKNV